MSEPNGLDRLNQRMERSRRTVPAPRRPSSGVADSTPSTPTDPAATRIKPESSTPVTPAVDASASPLKPVAQPTSVTAVSALFPVDEPQANLAVRVRRSLDLRLDDILYELRHRGIRSSKAELVELLLWELPRTLNSDLESRLAHFRRVAGRR